MSAPSKSEVNKMLRVLESNDANRQYTIQVHRPDGSKVEFQADSEPNLHWDNESRAIMIMVKVGGNGYSASSHPVMQWHEGTIILCEENPGWKKKD